MHPLIRVPLTPFVSIGARVVNSWASKLEPHASTLENFGIRVVASKKDGTFDNHEEAYIALVFLLKYEPEKLELVRKHIQTIYFMEVFTRYNGYLQSGKICILDIRKFANYPSGTVPIGIAGQLVYFSTFAELNISRTRKYAERGKFAGAERNRVVEKLEGILCE